LRTHGEGRASPDGESEAAAVLPAGAPQANNCIFMRKIMNGEAANDREMKGLVTASSGAAKGNRRRILAGR